MVSEKFIEEAIERNWKNNPDAPIFDEESELYRDIRRQLEPNDLGYVGEVDDDHYIHEHDISDWKQGEPFILTDDDDAISASSWSAVHHHCTEGGWLDDIIFLDALYDVFEEMKRIKSS